MTQSDRESVTVTATQPGPGPSLSIVTAWAGLALVSRAVREENRPRIRETTNPHNENDGVSKRVQELAPAESESFDDNLFW